MAPGWLGHFVAGLLVVVGFARLRFDRPAGARSYTTAGWYYFGFIVYGSGLVIAYAVAAVNAAFVLAGWLSPVPVALGLVLGVLNLPLISRVDAWIRRSLHRLIGVPAIAQRLADRLLDADLRPPEAVEAEVKSVLQRRGYDPDEDWFPAAEPMRSLWLKSAVLFHMVRGWEQDRRYRHFVDDAMREFDVLRQRFDQLSLKVVRVLETVDRLGAFWCDLAPEGPAAGPAVRSDPGARLKSIVSELLADLREDVAFFLRNLCLFAARAILAGALTANGRRRRLRGLGFTLEHQCRSIPSVLGWAFVSYVALFLGFMVVVPLVTGDTSGRAGVREGWSLRVLMIATIQVAALATAILPKERLGFANEDLQGRTPYRFIVAAGAAAVVFGALTQLFFLWLMADGSLADAWKRFATSSRWLVTAFTTAALTAFLIQDSRWAWVRSRAVRRLLDAGTLAAGTMVSVEAAVWLGAATTTPDPMARRLLCLLIGLVIGGTVPSARRHRLEEALHGRMLARVHNRGLRQRPGDGEAAPAFTGGGEVRHDRVPR